MLSGQRLAMILYVLVAEADKNAWLGFAASIQVKKFGEGNRKWGRGEVGCAV